MPVVTSQFEFQPNQKSIAEMVKSAADNYSFDRYLTGFGFAGTFSDVEVYFIYSDGSKSPIKTNTPLIKFKELTFDPVK